jgi:signal transduction histidine kinase
VKAEREKLAERYESALRAYLEGAGEAALQQAYEVGRSAMAGGLGVAEMAELHHEALVRLSQRHVSAEELSRLLRAAGSLMVEGLSMFEMTHREFREANIALRRWNERLEAEAKRIAHALHDEAGQLLASVHLALEDVARDLEPPTRGRLLRVRELLDRIEEQMRRLSHELRPTILDDLGLVPALEFLARGVSSRTGLSITVGGTTEGRAPVLVETAVYRIVQEALSNVSRHARATQASVQVRREGGGVHCSVRDDGIGFDTVAVLSGTGERGLGLIGIRERLTAVGGALQIHSSPQRGTELLFSIPLEARHVSPDTAGR